MKLKSFSVQGFKNFRQELRMDDLRDVNVIHGPNSVGKSNLLQAIGLMFLALSRPDERVLPDAGLRALGLHEGDIFTHDSKSGIEINATLSSLETSDFGDDMTVRIELLKRKGAPIVRDISLGESNRPPPQHRRLAEIMGRMTDDAIDRAFALVGTARDAESAPVWRGQQTQSTLANELYDAQQSGDLTRVRRWRALQTAMRRFEEISGPGELVATLPRGQQNSRILFESAVARVPLSAMGTGFQQLVALFGRMLMTQASIVAIEEPELNLRSLVQRKLAEALTLIPQDPDSGIDQIFITSHSSDFERGPDFWSMEPGPEGPTIRRRPVSQVSVVTGVPATQLPESTIPHWVSSQGIMEVPERVRKRLGVENGGSVLFIDHPKGAILCNEKQALEEMLGSEIAETTLDGT